MQSIKSNAAVLKGTDQRAFSTSEYAQEIFNFFYNEKLAAWDSQVGFEPVEPHFSSKVYSASHQYPTISGHAFYTNNSRVEYLLQEKITNKGFGEQLSILYTHPDGTEYVIDSNRTTPGIDDPGTQYLNYGRFCIITNGKDRAIKFFGKSKTSPFGFTEAPGQLTVIGADPKLLVPDSSDALLPDNNNEVPFDGRNACLIPNINTVEYERSKFDGNYGYTLPSGWLLTSLQSSQIAYTSQCYWGLGVPEALEQNTYSYVCTFISDTGAESPPGPSTSVSWFIPAKTDAASGEANENSPNPYAMKFGCYITNIPKGGDNVVARRIYRTKNKRDGFVGASEEYYLVATINDNCTNNYIDFVPDNELVIPMPTSTETSLIAPNYKYVASWDGRIWMANGNGNENQLIYSKQGKPEQFGAFDFYDVGVRSGGGITGLYAYGNILLVFRESAVDIVTKYEQVYQIGTLHPNVGTRATNTIHAVDGLGVMFLSSDGVYLVSGQAGQNISVNRASDPVSQTMLRLTPGTLGKSTAVYSSKRKEYWLHFCADGSLTPNLGVVFHAPIQGWSIRGQAETSAAEASQYKLWNFNRLFADKDGDVIICPQTYRLLTGEESYTYYNIGLQVLSNADFYGFNLTGEQTMEGETTYETATPNTAESYLYGPWINYQFKGQTFSFVLRCYQTQARPMNFFTLVDRRLPPTLEAFNTIISAALMNADEYNSTESDYIYGFQSTSPEPGLENWINFADDTNNSTIMSNNRLAYIRIDTAVRARESVAFAWIGSERLLIQNFQVFFNQHSREPLSGGNQYTIANQPNYNGN
jgi:hypothetical protein